MTTFKSSFVSDAARKFYREAKVFGYGPSPPLVGSGQECAVEGRIDFHRIEDLRVALQVGAPVVKIAATVFGNRPTGDADKNGRGVCGLRHVDISYQCAHLVLVGKRPDTSRSQLQRRLRPLIDLFRRMDCCTKQTSDLHPRGRNVAIWVTVHEHRASQFRRRAACSRCKTIAWAGE